MKRFFCLLILLTLITLITLVTLSLCTDKKNDMTRNTVPKDQFLGTWVCELYNTNGESLGNVVYEIKEKDSTYYGVINKFYDDEESGIEFDDFFATDKELFFIKNNRVVERKEYLFDEDKLVVENNVFTRK